MLPRRFDLDSMFDNFLTPAEDMKCDVYEKDGNYYIEADMPGMDKKDVSVSYNDGYLTQVFMNGKRLLVGVRLRIF